MHFTRDKFRQILAEGALFSDGLRYHLEHGLTLNESIYRQGSEGFLELVIEARKWYNEGMLAVSPEDLEIIKSDLGEWGIYEGQEVMLDYPIDEEAHDMLEAEYKGRKVKLNKPKRGGKKKFYVYVRNPKTKKVKRIEFGAKGMSTGLRDPDRSKSFEKRHRCKEKTDKTKPGYWACRIGRYPKVTGAPYRRWW